MSRFLDPLFARPSRPVRRLDNDFFMFSKIDRRLEQPQSNIDEINLLIARTVSGVSLNIVEFESGVTTLNSIIDNGEQCGQHKIVQSCFQQNCNSS